MNADDRHAFLKVGRGIQNDDHIRNKDIKKMNGNTQVYQYIVKLTPRQKDRASEKCMDTESQSYSNKQDIN
jgi:hypothetical protein